LPPGELVPTPPIPSFGVIGFATAGFEDPASVAA
jgi:hypothetical protein